MSEDSRGPLSKVLVAVVIALAVGGSAPWWWNELYDRAVEERFGALAWLRVNPQVSTRIRSDPRFTALLKHLQLGF
jgi:hypothetical protein